MDLSLTGSRSPTLLEAAKRGFQANPWSVLLIVAINASIALILWQNDPRPFWHPLLTVQVQGLCIAYAVNVVRPWEHPRPMFPLLIAVLVATLVGFVIVVLLKQYPMEMLYTDRKRFMWSIVTAFINGLLISLLFFVKYREAHAAATLHRTEAARNLLERQAVEAQLKLMQAQVEPHFLFNTLASVQYLTETDPPRANRLLGHLIDYLRAALPQLRAESTTLAREVELARAYLGILQMRMGARLAFEIDVPDTLSSHPLPPNMLISLVENAIKHGLEPSAEGGVLRISARRRGEHLEVEVSDTGQGYATQVATPTRGNGIGLANVRERLHALFGGRGHFEIGAQSPRGTRAVIAVPWQSH